jgi:hypothetical protein
MHRRSRPRRGAAPSTGGPGDGRGRGRRFADRGGRRLGPWRAAGQRRKEEAGWRPRRTRRSSGRAWTTSRRAVAAERFRRAIGADSGGPAGVYHAPLIDPLFAAALRCSTRHAPSPQPQLTQEDSWPARRGPSAPKRAAVIAPSPEPPRARISRSTRPRRRRRQRRRSRAATAPGGPEAGATIPTGGGGAPLGLASWRGFAVPRGPADILADIRALPAIAVHSKALWVPFAVIVGITALFFIPGVSANPIVVLLGSLALQPPPMILPFFGGMLAPRGAWLVGGDRGARQCGGVFAAVRRVHELGPDGPGGSPTS